MTLVVAWLRSVGAVEELVVASDSRLRGGYAWDATPKIMPLPRGDSVIAFAGGTDSGYPLMLQAVNYVSSYDRASNRLLSLDELRGQLERVFNSMMQQLSEPSSKGQERPEDAVLLLAGYDWRAQAHRLWTIRYRTDDPGFRSHRHNLRRRGNLASRFRFVGDDVAEAKRRLVLRLQEGGKWPSGGLDFEPLQVLAEMVRSADYPSIGGFPQLVKVYRSLNVKRFAVEFDGQSSFMGRLLLDYENLDLVPTIKLTGDSVVLRSVDEG
jgi:hypothetical protein